MNEAAAQVVWRIGETIDGIYQVRQVIESGGLGLVHRVHHRGWNIDLAVKTPRPELVSSPQRIGDFEIEAQTWIGLGLHPHIVACVYVRRLGGLPRVFAEWVDGGSLAEAIESRRLYSGSEAEALARVLDVAIQFAWGLDYAHARGLVHQDVKPANVMLTTDWTVKVTDFGLAKARATAGETVTAASGGSLVAAFGGGLTPGYCSPEQAAAFRDAGSGGRPSHLSRATDVWSWAISVWEMFTGEPPCRHGQAASEAFEAFRNASGVKDSAVPALPATMAQLLARCLDSDLTTRPRRMGELADELVELYQNLVAGPYPRTKPEPAKLVADGLNNQALSLLDLGQAEDAEQLWQQALSADPHQLHSIYNRGLHRWRCGRITDAELIDDLEMVRTFHEGPEADRLLALAHLERYDTTAAREALRGAARKSPEVSGIAEALTAAQRQGELAEPRPLAGSDSRTVFRAAAVSADGRIAVTDGGRGETGKMLQVWDLPTATCLRTLSGHTRQVNAVAVSPGGGIVISGSDDCTVRAWDAPGRKCLQVMTGHTQRVNRVAISADSRIAVSSGGDQSVRVWDVPSGACLHTLTGHVGEVRSVAVSATGRVAVSGGADRTVRVWDVHIGANTHNLMGHTGQVDSVAVSADGRTAASCSAADNSLRVWDLASGACVRNLNSRWVFRVAIAVDARIAFSRSMDETVRVWDLADGTCLRTLVNDRLPGEAGTLRTLSGSLAVSADGRTIVTTSQQHTAFVWEVPTARGHRAGWSYARPRSAYALRADAGAVEDAARRAEALFSAGDPTGAAVALRTARAIPGYRRDRRLVSLWCKLADLGARGRLQDAWPQHTLVGQPPVAVSASGRIALSGGRDRTVQVWDAGSGAHLLTLPGLTPVGILADGRIATYGGGAIRMWDPDGGATSAVASGYATAVAVSADGRFAVSAKGDDTVRVWDLATGTLVQALTGHTEGVTAVALSGDGRVAVSGSSDTTVRVWDLETGACLHTLAFHDNWVKAVAVSADGRFAISIATGGERVRVWDLDRGVCLRTLDAVTDAAAVALSADGRIAVTAGRDKSLRVWDWATKACLHTLTGHTERIRDVALSADATVAVTAGDDETVRVWLLDWEYEFGAR
jgi:WD40 repeat protein/serine/threonine protein kinase